jgi:hypothetical protein
MAEHCIEVTLALFSVARLYGGLFLLNCSSFFTGVTPQSNISFKTLQLDYIYISGKLLSISAQNPSFPSRK